MVSISDYNYFYKIFGKKRSYLGLPEYNILFMSKNNSIQLKAGVIITVGMLFATFSFYAYQLLFTPNVQLEKTDTYLYIPSGATFETVKDSLDKNEILNDKVSFYFLTRLLKYRENVKPGRYLLKANSTNLSVVRMLKRGNQAPVKLTFNNIRIKSDLAELLSKKMEFSAAEFLGLLNDKSFVEKYGFNTSNVIGMFIPNTYELYWNVTAEHFIEKMHQEYQKFWNENRRAQAKAMGFSPAQVTVLASIVEAETNYNKEKPRVAGVYINRLHASMPLQADPTVKFAMGDFSIKRIYTVHTTFNSPYNTYMYAGLPPGPINLPSITTIDAVLNYEKHKYLYFCADSGLSGKHEFAETYAQHQKIAEKYRRALNKLRIK